jgi:hypothetical protein
MANDPPFATLNHVTGDLGIPSESALLRIGIKPCRQRSSDALARLAMRVPRPVHRRLQRPCAGSAGFPTRGKPDVFNTDQGSQFTSAVFTGVLANNGTTISMDGKRRLARQRVRRAAVAQARHRSRSPPPSPARSAPRRPSASYCESPAPLRSDPYRFSRS